MTNGSEPSNKIAAISKIVTPVLVAILGAIGSIILAQINNNLDQNSRSVDVMTHFRNAYAKDSVDSRRLSIYFIRMIDDKNTRTSLREYVVWNILERDRAHLYPFDSDYSDWHMLGDVLHDMRVDNPPEAKKFWADLKGITTTRWSADKVNLEHLYGWIEQTYPIR